MVRFKINKEKFIEYCIYKSYINSFDLSDLDLSEFTNKSIPKVNTEDWKHTGLSNFEYIKTLL